MNKKLFVLCMVVAIIFGGCVSNLSHISAKTSNVQTPVSNTNLSYAFTQAGDHPEKILIGVIGEAKSSLDIAIYSLTHPDIIQAIFDAKKRGIVVRIISDKTEAKSKLQSAALKKLKDEGIPEKINSHSGLMHLKVTIVDKKIFTTGSFNYSKAAATTNDEVLIIDRDPVAAVKWDQEFESMWNNNNKFASY